MLHGAVNHPLEEEGRVQLKQPSEALSAESLCAAWTKLFHGELALLFGLKQALGKRNLHGKGGVWGAVVQELSGREEGPLQRQGGAGR